MASGMMAAATAAVGAGSATEVVDAESVARAVVTVMAAAAVVMAAVIAPGLLLLLDVMREAVVLAAAVLLGCGDGAAHAAAANTTKKPQHRALVRFQAKAVGLPAMAVMLWSRWRRAQSESGRPYPGRS